MTIPDGYGPPVLVCSRTYDVVPIVTWGEQEYHSNCELCGADVLIIPEALRRTRNRWECDPIIRCSPCARVLDRWVPHPAKRRRQRKAAGLPPNPCSGSGG